MSKRLFIGLEISEEARENIADHSMRLRDRFRTLKVGWERPEKYHITVKFLGEVKTAKFESIFDATAQIANKFKPILLEIISTGVFPSAKNSKIVWIGVDEEHRLLEKMALHFVSEFEKLGFKKEKRIFLPHITVARIRKPEKAAELAVAHLNEKIEPVQFTVSEIVIFESVLNPTGSIYIPLKRFPILT